MKLGWTVLAAVAILAVPAAAQQEASFSLEQKNVASQAEVVGGQRVDLPLTVNLTGEGFTCTQEVEAPVNVTAEASLASDAPPNAQLETTDAEHTFPIPTGEYQVSAYGQETNTTVSASAASGLQENTTATLTLTSNYPGGEHTGCLPMQFSPATSEPAEVEVSLIADDPPEPEPPDEPDDDPADDNTTAPPTNDTPTDPSEDEDDNGIPLPWQAAPLAAIAAALAIRRREGGAGR